MTPLSRVPNAVRLCLAIGIATACQDPAVALTSENNVRVTNTPTLFRIQADNLDNVIDDTTFTWATTLSQAQVVHVGLITHGEGDLVVHDANDSLVYSGILEYEKDSLTYIGPNKGTPGNWTVEIILKAATGKVDVTLQTPPP